MKMLFLSLLLLMIATPFLFDSFVDTEFPLKLLEINKYLAAFIVAAFLGVYLSVLFFLMMCLAFSK